MGRAGKRDEGGDDGENFCGRNRFILAIGHDCLGAWLLSQRRSRLISDSCTVRH